MQSIFPLTGSEKKRIAQCKSGRRLGFELAIPLTILAFLGLAELSPILKMHLDRVLDWLSCHDAAATTLETIIILIPFWMLAVMLYERFKK